MIYILAIIFIGFIYFVIRGIVNSEHKFQNTMSMNEIIKSWEKPTWTWENYIPDDTEVIAELKRFSKRRRRKFATKRRRNHIL